MSSCKRAVIVGVLGFFLAGLSTRAGGQEVVGNTGFEDPVQADGTWGLPAIWQIGFYDLAVDPTVWVLGVLGGDDAGVWNPDAGVGFSDGAAFAGQNAGWVVSNSGLDVGLSQILDVELEDDTEYVLSVQVGNPFYNESDETAPYRIELLANGILLEYDSGDSPVADTWELHSLTYHSANNPELVGEALEIRLMAVEYTDASGAGGYEVDFDDVHLLIEGPGGPGEPQGNSFTRGDANTDGNVDISDPTTTLQYLFLGGAELRCVDAADTDDDGMLSLTDAIYVLNHLFLGTTAPPAPYPGCGRDETVDGFECETSPANCE